MWEATITISLDGDIEMVDSIIEGIPGWEECDKEWFGDEWLGNTREYTVDCGSQVEAESLVEAAVEVTSERGLTIVWHEISPN